MKTFILKQLIIFFLLSGFVAFCQAQSNLLVKCPILVGPKGTKLMMSFESAKKLCKNRIRYVDIEEMEKGSTSARDIDKNVFESTKNDSMILVSEASKKYYTAAGFFLMFKGKSDNSYWFGFDKNDGTYYILKKDSSLQIIGYSERKYRTTPEGSYVLTTKGTLQGDFFAGSTNGKIYKPKEEDGAEQIGILSYFWLPPDKNTKLQRAIVMTKGMKETDKWRGELDGVIYIQK